MKVNGIDIGITEVFDFTKDNLNPSYFYVKLSDMIYHIKEEREKTSEARRVLSMLYNDHNISDEDMHEIVTSELQKEKQND